MALKSLKAAFHRLKATGRLRDLCIFAGFVVVAAAFWCILTLNEEAQTDFEVRLKIVGVPDSVTLITDPPGIIHVSVRDRGSHLLRLRLMREAEVKIDFKEFASDGRLRVSSRALLTHVRGIFGQGATVSIISADSISAPYTTMPGKMVPVRVVTDIMPELGKVVSGSPKSSVKQVKVFALRDVIDTISYVSTERIVRRGVNDSFTQSVKLRPINGARFEPSSVQVTVNVEPLENRRVTVPISQTNVPSGQSLVLFPDKVEINYLVPMSRTDIPVNGFSVQADYRTIGAPSDQRMPLSIGAVPPGVTNATLLSDSVAFTIIRHER